jgi:hypothetical protein
MDGGSTYYCFGATFCSLCCISSIALAPLSFSIKFVVSKSVKLYLRTPIHAAVAGQTSVYL